MWGYTTNFFFELKNNLTWGSQIDATEKLTIFEKQPGTAKVVARSNFKKASFLNMQRTLLLKFYHYLSAEKYPKGYA